MSFVADEQTLADLNLLGKYRPNSIFSLFNKTRTGGGERLLQEMFARPLTDAKEINARSGIFRYFQDRTGAFPLDPAAVLQMENYCSMGTGSNYLWVLGGAVRKKIMARLFRDEQYENLQTGLEATIRTLDALRNFIDQLGEDHGSPESHSSRGSQVSPFSAQALAISKILSDPRLTHLNHSLSVTRLARYDHLLRHILRDEMEALVAAIHRLDVYMAVAETGRQNGFNNARAFPRGDGNEGCKFEALRHPALPRGVANDLHLHTDSNMFFLTGANMAGKSTFMKAFGIAVYLAHMGFPVAAGAMQFTVFDGLYSSINVPDNLNMGYSHFYAEVLRVKKVALDVSEGRNLVVLFDELFKGTNVKDAYDATLSVTASFAAYRNCLFMISTHITEVGHALRERTGNLQFSYLPTVLEGNVPRYPYRLTEGISSDRQGMMIIENEGILEMLT